MPFYVYAQDRLGVGGQLDDLVEEHWSYMDRFADQLILRGPTVSDDGTEHTGSLHVVDLADRAGAERFATEEPFWSAGLYREITTVRTVVLLHRDPTEGTLVTGRWFPEPHNADLHLLGADPDSRLGFLALLVDDDQSSTTGIVSIVTALPGDAPSIVQPFAEQLTGQPIALTAQSWERGGRR